MNLISHICHIREKLKEVMELANANQTDSEKQMKTWYDQNAKLRSFDPGDEVLILLPTTERTLEAQWQGQFQIAEKVGDLDYIIEVGKGPNKRRQKYHVNMLKQWKSRSEISCFAQTELNSENSNNFIVQYNPNQTEDLKDLNISEDLSNVSLVITITKVRLRNHSQIRQRSCERRCVK